MLTSFTQIKGIRMPAGIIVTIPDAVLAEERATGKDLSVED